MREGLRVVIGVTGTHASGKDTVAGLICERFETKDYSTSTEIGHELSLRGMDHSRANKVSVGNELRKRFGPGELARRALARASESFVVISAIRNVGEIEYLRQNSCFFLISVDAPIELRYKRSCHRERFGDGKTFSDFRALEDRERDAGATGQQLFPCMALADFSIVNDSTPEHLRKCVGRVLDKILAWLDAPPL